MYKNKINDKLKEFRQLLETENRTNLIDFFDKNIDTEYKKKVNELKKMIYVMMTRYKKLDDIETSRKYYCLYQQLKKNQINYEKAFDKFFEIE